MTTIDYAGRLAAVGSRSGARAERCAFWLCVAAGAGLMWLAPKPPLVDLPAHAAQIALWRDLLRGASPWSSFVFVNLLTPYLIGYGAALPLSFVTTPETAIAAVFTLAFLGFVGSCVLLRKELGSDERLDWMFIPSFFGFAWGWGFYTFLTAAPVLLIFLWSVLRHARQPSVGRGSAALALGVALLFSHGLLFLFGVLCAGLILLGGWREPLTARIRRLWPVVALGALLAAFALVTHQRGTATPLSGIEYGTPLWLRPFAAISYVVSDNWDPDPLLACCAGVILSTPFFLRDRIQRGPALILFGALAATFLLTPAFAFDTGYLFPRFALFLPPFTALLFRRAEAKPLEGGERMARLVMALLCFVILCDKGLRLRRFAKEAAAFDRIEQAALPGKRALAVIFDRASPAAGAARAYAHFGAWYQADRGGFVDFNFAQLPPQVVRFRPGRIPPIGLRFLADPNRFDWSRDQGWVYDYFFFRGAADPLAWLRGRSPCAFSLAASDAGWALVRRMSCPASAEGGATKS